MGQMSTKCARLRQWWSFRGPTSGGEADPWRTAVLCQCWIVGARSPALGAAYLRKVQVGVRDAGSMRGTSRGDVCGGEGLGCFGSVVI